MVLKRVLTIVTMAAALAIAPPAQAGYVQVFGGATYDAHPTYTGFTGAVMEAAPGSCVNNTGTAVGWARKNVGGSFLGDRAVRWDSGGAPATELGNIGTDDTGRTDAYVYAVNDANTAVGYARMYTAENYLGYRAVRWDAGGAATELGDLGTNSAGHTTARAYAVNDANTAVGWAQKYVDGSDLGWRAVRWDGGGSAATELGNLGTGGTGGTGARAYAVNDANTAVGYANKFVAGRYRGERAVRWDAGGTAPTELGILGLDIWGETSAYAFAVNNSNTAVGWTEKYVDGSYRGKRAVRWDDGRTAATELGHIGASPTGETATYAYAVNDANTAVGYAAKYIDGIWRGSRAVRWDGGGTAATELGNLGIGSDGFTAARALAVSNANTAVGYAAKYVGGSGLGQRAVMWGPDGVAVDLNTLIDPASGWTLTKACDISEDGLWVGGEGLYDPGSMPAYDRLWLIQVPEPATLSLLALGGLAMIRRRRLARHGR